VLEALDAAKLEPGLTNRATMALLVPEHGFVGPGPLIDALVRAATARGVSMVQARATNIDAIRADAIVIAAGSWSAEFAKTPPFVKPIRGQLLALSMNPRPRRGSCGALTVTSFRGATARCSSAPRSKTSASTSGQQQRAYAGCSMRRLIWCPVWRTRSFARLAAGLRPKTADELPAIGRSSTMPHVFYATGHYRNGVLLAPLTATLIADLVLDGRERPELADVRPDRFGL
jgi:glycine/D-amino acid oxidase-like deaminating enzyme